MRVLKAPDQLDSFEKPSIFLGGGITGAPDWQKEALELLKGTFATCFNPRRPEGFLPPDHPNYLQSYSEQVDWEHKYLLQAEVVLFWLPKEANSITTRFEIGWFYGMNYAQTSKASRRSLAVGIEPGVNGDTYYRIVLPRVGIPVHSTLEETCKRACELVR